MYQNINLDNQMYEDEEEYYDDSEPEEPLYNRQELMDKYHVSPGCVELFKRKMSAKIGNYAEDVKFAKSCVSAPPHPVTYKKCFFFLLASTGRKIIIAITECSTSA